MAKPVIRTPRGIIIEDKSGKASLVWYASFETQLNQNFQDAQVFLDSEILRLCEPYIPLLTGMLVKSGILGTVPGTGLIQWIAPYAHRRYYDPRKPGTSTGPLRGPHWFDRMYAVNSNYLLSGVSQRIRRSR